MALVSYVFVNCASTADFTPSSSEPTGQVAAALSNVALYVDGSAVIKGPGPWVDVTAFGAGQGGADDSANIQSAINSLASTGGIVYFPPGTYNINPGAGVTGITISTNDITLQGAGSGDLRNGAAGTSLLKYTGSTSNFTVLQAGASNVHIRDISFQTVNDGFAVTAISLPNVHYFDVSNVTIWGKTGGTNNQLVGISVQASICGAPPVGYGHIMNYLYYAADSSAHPGSRGIRLLGGTGTAPDGGTCGTQVQQVVVDGWGDIENADVGVEFNNASENVLAGAYLVASGTNNLTIINDSLANTVAGHIDFVRTGPASCNLSTGVGCHILIDSTSRDNKIDGATFNSPSINPVFDQGTRTLWINTGADATQRTIFPWTTSIGTFVSAPFANETLCVGPPVANVPGGNTFASFTAPNTNFGPAATFVADGLGRGVDVVSQGFNDNTNTGTILSMGVGSQEGAIFAQKNGVSTWTPLILGASDVELGIQNSGIVLKDGNGACWRIVVSPTGVLGTQSVNPCYY